MTRSELKYLAWRKLVGVVRVVPHNSQQLVDSAKRWCAPLLKQVYLGPYSSQRRNRESRKGWTRRPEITRALLFPDPLVEFYLSGRFLVGKSSVHSMRGFGQ